MGLDMYAWRCKQSEVIDDFNMVKPSSDDQSYMQDELHYWRKHHDLHGWMAKLYKTKGGPKSEFNCAAMRLYTEDLDALEKAVVMCELPQTTGFFFGENPPDDGSMRNDLKFIVKAREAIAAGDAVYYDSWW